MCVSPHCHCQSMANSLSILIRYTNNKFVSVCSFYANSKPSGWLPKVYILRFPDLRFSSIRCSIVLDFQLFWTYNRYILISITFYFVQSDLICNIGFSFHNISHSIFFNVVIWGYQCTYQYMCIDKFMQMTYVSHIVQ